ncbi:MAG: hypothetical protein M3N93_00455 [Acidobacteriota bacterium]|nr:hypothetical protein [Acidobacteriota bacterium]
MAANLRHHLRYWGFLLLKFAAAGFGAGFALWFLNLFWAPHTKLFHLAMGEFSYDLLYTFLAGVWFQLSFGLFCLAIWDQRYRCRTCLRRLCMPIETGSWGSILQLGRPKMEYICPYGHGKLNIEELQFTGKAAPEWTEQGDIWEELFAASGKDSDCER